MFSGSYRHFIEVRIGRAQPPTVGDGHREHFGDPTGECDVAAIGRTHRGTPCDGEVDPPMSAVEANRSKRAHHRPAYRHGETWAVGGYG